MSDRDGAQPIKPGAFKRRAVSVSQAELIKTDLLRADAPLPLVMTPALEGVDLVQFVASNRDLVNSYLLKHGGLLFRGFGIREVAAFEALVAALSGSLLEYSYRSTPRSQVSGKIYTSTEYPAEQTIPLHNEMAYSRSWPMKIWFFSVICAEQGGETPIADSHKVYERIDPAIRRRFAEKQVMYVRNYGAGIDLPWQNVFQTEDRAEVERFCRAADIAFEWQGADALQTRQVCQGVAQHPTTGAPLWFNQAHLFHISSLEPSVREALLATLGEEALPRNAYYGDGRPIEAAVLDEIRAAYAAETVSFPWQQGDILLLDNMLVAHGRAPFKGPRKVVVGMAETVADESRAQPQEAS